MPLARARARPPGLGLGLRRGLWTRESSSLLQAEQGPDPPLKGRKEPSVGAVPTGRTEVQQEPRVWAALPLRARLRKASAGPPLVVARPQAPEA